jgi:hypothetical protein
MDTSISLEFLEIGYIDKTNHLLNLSKEVIEKLIEAESMIKGNAVLIEYLTRDYATFFKSRKEIYTMPEHWNRIREIMGQHYGMYPIVLLLSGLEDLVAYYKEKGISEEILVDTLSDLNIWIATYNKNYGVWGLEEFFWLINHFRGKLFRLGRLQFLIRTFPEDLRVYRNKSNKSIVVLAEDGINYRKDGQRDGTNKMLHTEGMWTSKLVIGEGFIEGNQIMPKGYAVSELTRLKLEDWELVLSNKDLVLDMHMPEGSKLEHELCGKAIERAISFYGKYFPEINYAAFTCMSWLLSQPVELMLPADSNIIRYKREFFLFPMLSDDHEFHRRVFGKRITDLEKAPQNTSFQRALREHLMSGKEVYEGGGFILREDMNWGKQVYWEKGVC